MSCAARWRLLVSKSNVHWGTQRLAPGYGDFHRPVPYCSLGATDNVFGLFVMALRDRSNKALHAVKRQRRRAVRKACGAAMNVSVRIARYRTSRGLIQTRLSTGSGFSTGAPAKAA